MYQFNVADMTCGHCVSSVTKAVKSVDAAAKVDVALAHKRVTVASALPREAIAEAIQEAGYTPVAV